MNVQGFDSRLRSYTLNTDPIAAGAGKVMFDLFNDTGNALNTDPRQDILLLLLQITPESDAAVTGVVSARFDLFRTSSIGTGGTSSSYNAPVATKINITPQVSSHPALSPYISARSAPTAGANLGPWLCSEYVFPEETSSQAITQQNVNVLPEGPQVEPFVLRPGEGLVVQQGSVASLNNYMITVVFALSKVK